MKARRNVVKIVHAADLHLDSPQHGLLRYEGAPVEQCRGATRRAFSNLVSLCLTEKAKLLLLAGDLYDGNWRDYSTGLFFAKEMARLREGGVRVVSVRGNHDAASHITRHLQLPDNVRELSTSRAETFVLEDLGVAVHGQGFGSRAVLEDLAVRYPDPLPSLLNVGLLHTCGPGRDGHEPYAPCSLETLKNKGYDYWALGHVHEREVLSTEPWVVYPGNLQGRHPREAGPKGATLLEVEDGRVVGVRHCELDVVRWTLCEIDVSDAASADDALDLVRTRFEGLAAESEGRLWATRVLLRGWSRAHAGLSSHRERYENEIRAVAVDIAPEAIWIERICFETRAAMDVSRLSERGDAIGQVVRSLAALRADPEAQAALLSEFSELRSKLPAELRDGPEPLLLDDPRTMAEALEELEGVLVPRLLAMGDEE